MLDKKSIISQSFVFKRMQDGKVRKRFLAHKHRLFIVGIIIGFIIVLLTYFNSSYAKVYRVSVNGNYLLTREEIVDLAGIDSESNFLFVRTSKIAKKLKSNPMIKEANVKLLNDRIVEVEIDEYKLIGYTARGDKAHFILDNGELIEANAQNLKYISSIPLIEGFNDEQLKMILDDFKNIDRDLINQISEIHRFPFSYDENMLEVIMKDGNYVFLSSSGLDLLNQYYDVASSLDNPKEDICLYFDEVTNTGFTSACPWNKEINQNISEEDE